MFLKTGIPQLDALDIRGFIAIAASSPEAANLFYKLAFSQYIPEGYYGVDGRVFCSDDFQPKSMKLPIQQVGAVPTFDCREMQFIDCRELQNSKEVGKHVEKLANQTQLGYTGANFCFFDLYERKPQTNLTTKYFQKNSFLQQVYQSADFLIYIGIDEDTFYLNIEKAKDDAPFVATYSISQLIQGKSIEIKEVQSLLGGTAMTMFFNDSQYFIHKTIVEKYKLVNGMPISNQFAATIKLESEKCKNEDFPINRPSSLSKSSNTIQSIWLLDEKND